MEINSEITTLRNKLKELKEQSNRLFASHVELRIRLSIITDQQEELRIKNQYLLALSQFLLSHNFNSPSPVASAIHKDPD